MSLKHDYFIIESMPENDISDGHIFCKAIKSTNKYSPIYKPVNTQSEFAEALIQFSNSDFKYLFVSAHGDDMTLELVEGFFDVDDLADLQIDLKNRRIFMSTCKGGSYLLARYFIEKGAYSVIGCPNNLAQIVATALWTTMVCLFERFNQYSLDFNEINKALKYLTKIYHTNLAYYSFIRGESKMKEYKYSYKTARQRIDYPIECK